MDLDHPEYIKLRLEDTASKPCFREPYPKSINDIKCNTTTDAFCVRSYLWRAQKAFCCEELR